MLNKVYILRKFKEIKEYEARISKRLEKLDEYIEGRVKKFEIMDFKPKGVVADFGTGIGVDLISLSRLHSDIELVGIDITSKGLKTAKELMSKEGKEFHLVRADILFLPFKDNVFDAINFSHVLHHHPFSLLKRILEEANRVAKKNSQILIAEPSDLNESYEFSREIDNLWNGIVQLEKLSSIYNLKDLSKIGYDLHVFGYYGHIYPSILKRLLENYGFKVKTRFVSESLQMNEIIDKMRKNIESLILDAGAKEYLIKRLEDIKEKYTIIKPPYKSTLYLKAVRD